MVSSSLKFPLDQVCICISYVLLQENKYFGDSKIPAVKCKLPSMQERPWKLLSVVFFFTMYLLRRQKSMIIVLFFFFCVYIVWINVVKTWKL